MKNIFIICVIVIVLLAFAGCGSGTPEQTEHDVVSEAMETLTHGRSTEAAGAESSEPDKDAPSIGMKDGSLSVATGKSAELPKNYPSDKFPIYEGGFIYSSIELDGSYTLTVYSEDEVGKVVGFYEKVLEGAQASMETKTDESLTSMGTKSGYAYTLDVGKSTEKDYRTIITISLQPEE